MMDPILNFSWYSSASSLTNQIVLYYIFTLPTGSLIIPRSVRHRKEPWDALYKNYDCSVISNLKYSLDFKSELSTVSISSQG